MSKQHKFKEGDIVVIKIKTTTLHKKFNNKIAIITNSWMMSDIRDIHAYHTNLFSVGGVWEDELELATKLHKALL